MGGCRKLRDSLQQGMPGLGTKENPPSYSQRLLAASEPSRASDRPSKTLYFFFFLRPQRCWPAFPLPPSSLRLLQVGMGASSSSGRPPRSGTSPISTLLMAQLVPRREATLVAGTRRERSARAARTCATETLDSGVRSPRIGNSTAFMASPRASARSPQWKADVVRSRRFRRRQRRQQYCSVRLWDKVSRASHRDASSGELRRGCMDSGGRRGSSSEIFS